MQQSMQSKRQTKTIYLAKSVSTRYNNPMLGAGFFLYAVGVRAPSVWAVCLRHSAPAGILFCFASFRHYYIPIQTGKQE
jgi:hypothetical protein